MRGIIYIFYFIICVRYSPLSSQDLVYSQHYASPLTTNPAMTGVFNGSARLFANYRSQWNNIQTNTFLYQTPSASAEFSVPDKNIAVGFILLNDQTNNKIFNTLEGGMSFGYKIRLNFFEISLGIQGWYRQVYFDQSKIRSSIISVEPSLLDSYSNLDLNTGAVATYVFPSEKSSLFYGAAVHHILAPRDQVVNNTVSAYALPMRFTFHTGGSFSIRVEFRIIPGLLASYQSKSTQINFGTSVGFHFMWDEKDRPSGTLFVGSWFRTNETKIQAFIPQAGIEYNNFRIGLSYDYVVNGLSNGSGGRPNTFELSLGYIFKTDKSTDFQCIYSPYF